MDNKGNNSQLPIGQKDLEPYLPRASQLIQAIKYTTTRTAGFKQPVSSGRQFSEAQAEPTEETKSLLKIAQAVSNDMVLLSDASNFVLNTVRTGIALGLYLANQYKIASNLEVMTQLNISKQLPASQHAEFAGKQTTAASAALMGLASYVVWKLSTYEADKISAITMLEAERPETNLMTFHKAIDCAVFGLCEHVSQPGLVEIDLQMVKATIRYFEAVIKEIKFKEAQFTYTEAFVNVSYKLVDTEFCIKGYEEQSSAALVTNEFNRISFGEIVGNDMAKHAAKRNAQRLVCYDPVAKRNPFSVIGGMSLLDMGFGSPGTGKSMQISATATTISDYCERIGIPFVFHPMPQSIVSTYQGGSAERMIAWMRMLHDTKSIVYMPIDDAESNFRNRTHEGVSTGVREVIAVLLTETEGASAPRYGNAKIQFFTNLPEQLDPAVLSRVTGRFPIDGAILWQDFVDQNYLWLKSLGDTSEFIGMSDPRTYTYLSKQAAVTNIGQLNVQQGVVTDERIKQALEEADKHCDRKNHEFFGRLYEAVKKHYPLFTSRDVRNIQQAVNVRTTDFDIPDEWFDHPDKGFFAETFDRRVAMLRELRQECMKGLSFPEVHFEEAIRYLNTLANIANVERERKISAMLENMEIQQEALKRFEAS